MIKKIIPLVLILFIIGIFSAAYITNGTNSNSSNNNVIGSIDDNLLNTAVSDGSDNFYDKIIEKENLNLKNNFITNTLSKKTSNSIVYAKDTNKPLSHNMYSNNITLLNGTSKISTSITPNQAIQIANTQYPNLKFTKVYVSDRTDYPVYIVETEDGVSIEVDYTHGKVTGGYSSTEVSEDNLNITNSSVNNTLAQQNNISQNILNNNSQINTSLINNPLTNNSILNYFK